MSAPIESGSFAARALRERLATHVREGELSLPLLSTTATRVLAACSSETTDAAELAEIIQGDPALTGNVLRVANSAAYAPEEPIVSLSQAVSRLGQRSVSAIAVMVVVEGEVFQLDGHEAYLRELWTHSTVAGFWAREIARMRRNSTEGAFLCGLLHDVGKPVVLQALDTLVALDLCQTSPEVVRAWLDEFHGAVGGRMLREWGMPAWMGDVVELHHVPAGLESHRDEGYTVRFADLLAHWSRAGADEREALEAAFRRDACVLELGLYQDEVDELLAAKDRVETLARAFA